MRPEPDIAQLAFRIPDGIIDRYDIPVNQDYLERDLTSDRLIFKITPANYNAANTVIKETQLGYSEAFTEITKNLYELEATDTDQRAAVKRYILRDLLTQGGNLSLYGINLATIDCDEPLVALEDYHERNELSDEQRGYSLRVGILTIESLKGAYNYKDNIYVGRSYIISPINNLTSAAAMDATEWANYKVLEEYNIRKSIDSVWQPNTSYSNNQKLAAIAPQGAAKYSATTKVAA